MVYNTFYQSLTHVTENFVISGSIALEVNNYTKQNCKFKYFFNIMSTMKRLSNYYRASSTETGNEL